MKSTRLLSAAAALAVVGAALVAFPASAHTPAVSATCTTLHVELVSYTASEQQPTPNSITVSIDGAQVGAEAFGNAITRDYPFTDTTVGHDWAVHIDAVDNEFDADFTGKSEPCAPPPVAQDATAKLSVSDPTCDSPALLTLGETSHASWGTPSATTGPADYVVTATAEAGHVFEGNLATQEFSGHLAGKIEGAQCGGEPVPPVEPPVTPPTPPIQPEPTVTVTFDEAVDCSTDVITRTTTKTTTGSVLNPAGTAWVPTEPVIVETVTTRAAEQADCPTPPSTTVAETPPPGGDSLAVTGADPAPFLWIAGVLAALGGALLVRPRRRTA